MNLTANKPHPITPIVFRLGSGTNSVTETGVRNGLRRPTKTETNATPPARPERLIRIDQAAHQPMPSPKRASVQSPKACPAPRLPAAPHFLRKLRSDLPPETAVPGNTVPGNTVPGNTVSGNTVSGNAAETSIANDDQLNDHAGSLIEQLQKWSMELDERESRLDVREQELNRRQRILRQRQLIKAD